MVTIKRIKPTNKAGSQNIWSPFENFITSISQSEISSCATVMQVSLRCRDCDWGGTSLHCNIDDDWFKVLCRQSTKTCDCDWSGVHIALEIGSCAMVIQVSLRCHDCDWGGTSSHHRNSSVCMFKYFESLWCNSVRTIIASHRCFVMQRTYATSVINSANILVRL